MLEVGFGPGCVPVREMARKALSTPPTEAEKQVTAMVERLNEIAPIDRHLLMFCRAMQNQLNNNAGRGDWKEGLTGSDFDDGVERNLGDMRADYADIGYRSRSAVDLANFALMYWAALNNQALSTLTSTEATKEGGRG